MTDSIPDQRHRGALKKDAVNGAPPYEAIKKLRTLVGQVISDSTIASDVPRSKWTTLDAALPDDLSQAVHGNPATPNAWTRANNYSRAGMTRIEVLDDVIQRSSGSETIFRAATEGTRGRCHEAADRHAKWRRMTNGRKMISATVLRRLGAAKGGVQNDVGDVFSTETFLTNWATLSTEAKGALFNRHGQQFRQDLDQLAKVTANLCEGSQVFKNPSGTAQADRCTRPSAGY
ncbi:MAG TPA: hypothetical protein VK641_06565 [Terriglobales bacterium]|nr:hypothetical protein [Terriglobales bacterium]